MSFIGSTWDEDNCYSQYDVDKAKREALDEVLSIIGSMIEERGITQWDFGYECACITIQEKIKRKLK